MKELRKIWYISVSEKLYQNYPKIRLTDSQLAHIISEEFGGEESMHLMNIRRSGCNKKSQEYVKNNVKSS